MKVFIIEDDEWSKLILDKLITSYFPDLEVIGAASTISDAITLINDCEPDFILADIKLGNEDIFELINHFGEAWKYNYILTTSHENYALEAISSEVLDYIIKPITVEKLITAINKVKIRIKASLESKEENGNRNHQLIGISSVDKIEVIKIDSIAYIKANGRYSDFYLMDGSRKTASRNLGEYEKLLPNENFVRTHQSYLVNMNYVEHISKSDGYVVKLINNDKLIPISKRKQDVIAKFLKLKI